MVRMTKQSQPDALHDLQVLAHVRELGSRQVIGSRRRMAVVKRAIAFCRTR